MGARQRALVLGVAEGDGWRAGRTLRSARACGLDAVDCTATRGLAGALRGVAPGPLFLLRSGAWLAARRVAPPPAPASGRPLLALGAVLPAPLPAAGGDARDDGLAAAWAQALASNGGDLLAARAIPPVAAAFVDGALAATLAERLAGREPDTLEAALLAAALAKGARVVRYGPLDCFVDARLRVVQVVTSFQQGGAERVALDLARGLPEAGVPSRALAIGTPLRPSLPVPSGSLDLSRARPSSRAGFVRRLRREILGFGADLAQAHLLPRSGLRLLSRRLGLPTVVTVHNTRRAWPPGLARLAPGDVSLLVACARAVERQLRRARVPAPTRTVWNGIDAEAVAAPSPGSAADWRRRWGFGAGDLVLLCVANPRPQKRLRLLPGILAAARAAGAETAEPRETRLVLAGSAGPPGTRSAAELAGFQGEVVRLGLEGHVRQTGAVLDVASLYAAADVLVAPSAHEGLSLAQIEALAAGLPVVATSVGGTPELAAGNARFLLLPRDAPAEAWGRAVQAASRIPRGTGRPAAARDFSRQRMVLGYARLLRATAVARRPRRGLLLVTNNFSTGGAQSSARRLLLGLRAAGVPVRAAVVQEQPGHPTPGRLALERAGVPVLALPPPEDLDPASAVARLLEGLEDEAPEAVLLWNVIAEHKVLLADALLDVPVFDVSPGEMYFESLRRLFERPRPGLPYRSPADYGARLAGVVVKYAGEAGTARALLRAPVHVIRNGVALPPAPARGGSNGRLVVGTLARLDPRKRVDLLLRALRAAHPRLPPYVLRVAGAPERGSPGHLEELRALAEGLPVEFVGEPHDPQAFLAGLDLFALVAEPAGCPNASLEAMALGLPVVATDAGGMREQIEDSRSGRLVPRDDAAGLADAIVELAGDAAARRRLGAAARERVGARFDVGRMVAAYRRICLARSDAGA